MKRIFPIDVLNIFIRSIIAESLKLGYNASIKLWKLGLFNKKEVIINMKQSWEMDESKVIKW